MKALPTLGVFGLWTGKVLSDFGVIHEVFDHFYPGIGQIGCCMMAEQAKAEIEKQLPIVKDWPYREPVDDYAAELVKAFGPTIDLHP